jgi:hypothetical protein
MHTRILLGLLAGLTVVAVGCGPDVALEFENHTGRAVDLELEGDYDGDDDIGYVPPYGRFRFNLDIDEDRYPYRLELEAGRNEVEFYVDAYTPRTLYFYITPHGLLGPMQHDEHHRDGYVPMSHGRHPRARYHAPDRDYYQPRGRYAHEDKHAYYPRRRSWVHKDGFYYKPPRPRKYDEDFDDYEEYLEDYYEDRDEAYEDWVEDYYDD